MFRTRGRTSDEMYSQSSIAFNGYVKVGFSIRMKQKINLIIQWKVAVTQYT